MTGCTRSSLAPCTSVTSVRRNRDSPLIGRNCLGRSPLAARVPRPAATTTAAISGIPAALLDATCTVGCREKGTFFIEKENGTREKPGFTISRNLVRQIRRPIKHQQFIALQHLRL